MVQPPRPGCPTRSIQLFLERRLIKVRNRFMVFLLSSVTDEDTLTLTIPSVGPGRATIVLTNNDGTSYTDVGLLTIQ